MRRRTCPRRRTLAPPKDGEEPDSGTIEVRARPPRRSRSARRRRDGGRRATRRSPTPTRRPSEARPTTKRRGGDSADAKPTRVEAAEARCAKPEELPAIEPPDPKAEPWPDATPQPMKPVEPRAVRASRTATVAMPADADLGRPPDMPTTSAPPPLVLGAVEDPTHMPGPQGHSGGQSRRSGAAARAACRPAIRARCAAATSSRSIYRVGTCVITPDRRVGTRGQWRVVEYPTSASAEQLVREGVLAIRLGGVLGLS